MKKIIQQLSVDTRLVFERFIAAHVGDTITYSEINTILGRPDTHPASSVIQAARRKALTERRMVFGTIVNVGIKRLSDVEIVNTSEQSLNKMRRASKRAARRIAAVDFDTLPNETKIKHNTYLSMFGALASITTSGSLKKLENKIAESRQQLPLAKTLDSFK